MTKPTIECSKRKDRLNLDNHGISLTRAVDFDFNAAAIFPDDAQDYGEERLIAIGFLAGTLYTLIYVEVTDSHFRVISLRKASSIEESIYADY